jgi:hypothetical protein
MEYYNYKLTSKNKEYCSAHAQKMADGFPTYSFKNDENQSLDVYNIGKIGEFAFFKFLDEQQAKGLLKIKHTPFRESYEKMNFKDDYIIEINGKDVQIEVRTKGRNVDPQPDYECCTDSIKPHFVYVFISFNKKTDTVSVLGYANWDNFKEHAQVTLKGNTNSNFQNKVNEFNIKIKHLNNIQEIINL